MGILRSFVRSFGARKRIEPSEVIPNQTVKPVRNPLESPRAGDIFRFGGFDRTVEWCRFFPFRDGVRIGVGFNDGSVFPLVELGKAEVISRAV